MQELAESRERPLTAYNGNSWPLGPTWIADVAYVVTWSGFFYVTFVIDVIARSIVGWRVSRSMADEAGARGAGAAPHARHVAVRSPRGDL